MTVNHLQISFEILSSDEERRVYDWALQRYDNRQGTYIWPYETDITQRYNPEEVPLVVRFLNSLLSFLGVFVGSLPNRRLLLNDYQFKSGNEQALGANDNRACSQSCLSVICFFGFGLNCDDPICSGSRLLVAPSQLIPEMH